MENLQSYVGLARAIRARVGADEGMEWVFQEVYGCSKDFFVELENVAVDLIMWL